MIEALAISIKRAAKKLGLIKHATSQSNKANESDTQPEKRQPTDSPAQTPNALNTFSKTNTTPQQLARILESTVNEIDEWIELQWQTKEANEHLLYDHQPEFNQSLDLNNKISIGSSSFSRSYLLFMTDRTAYKAQLDEWMSDRDEEKIKFVKDKILHIGENSYRITLLINKIQKKRVTPFVGAGLSMAAGLPGWSNFLIRCAQDHNLDLNYVDSLLKNGDFEGCADFILEATHPELLKEKFQIHFQEPDQGTYSHEVLTKIATWGLVTTNYDKLLERSFERFDSKFDDIFYGPDEEIHSEFIDGNHVLLKMHGDINRPSKRILTTDEYNHAYGANKIDSQLPLPKFFTSFFSNMGILFIGCSLFNDRTMKLLKHIKETSKSGVSHFAIVPLPTSEKKARENFLISHGIYPIWYPDDDHNSVENILTYIKNELMENS